MTKEIKIIIAGVIIFLFLLAVAFVCLTINNGRFAWGLLSDAFILTMISISISILIFVIVYLLYDWTEE